MSKYEEIKARYIAGWISDSQLEKYVDLKVITKKQVDEIKMIKNEIGG